MLSDRDYMRTSEPGQSGSVLKWILWALVIVFAAQMFAQFLFKRPLLTEYFALSNKGFMDSFRIWTPVTYGFLHATGDSFPFHLVLNVLIIYLFGVQVQKIVSQDKFLILFFGGVIMGGLLWLVFNLSATRPLVGASAGAYALLIFYCCYFKDRTLSLFFLPLFFKAKYLGIGVAIITTILFVSEINTETMQDNGHDRTAHAAHLGGIFWGWFFYQVLLPVKINWGSSKRSIPTQKVTWKRPARAKASAFDYKVNISNRDDLKQEVDRILDKINSQGFGALTEEEKKTLDQARDVLKH